MSSLLTAEQQADFLKRGFSRRNFGRLATVLTAGATLPFYSEHALAQLSRVRNIPPDAVLINANENPLGPCPEAAEAIYNVVKKGGRYNYDLTDGMVRTLADIEGLKPEYIAAYAGSSLPLHTSVMAFTSPARSLVIGDPGYEAGPRAAEFVGAKVNRIPLRNDGSHDVKAMIAADPNAGVFYVCNPNNPTGTLTSRADIEWLLANKPAGSILLLDEAYIHFSDAQRGSDLVAADKDIVILRTFSKLFGMAGLRAGAALGRPDLLTKIRNYGAEMMPITGMVGADTSLKVKTLVPERAANLKIVREDTFAFLDKNNIKYVPSVSNCFMMDTKRPGMEFVKAMLGEKVFIGRVWQAWPTWARVTVGTKEEMAKFQAATLKVYNS
jgi:histidinol-phosphate aminotransferase